MNIEIIHVARWNASHGSKMRFTKADGSQISQGFVVVGGTNVEYRSILSAAEELAASWTGLSDEQISTKCHAS